MKKKHGGFLFLALVLSFGPLSLTVLAAPIQPVLDRALIQTDTNPLFVGTERSLQDETRLTPIAEWTIPFSQVQGTFSSGAKSADVASSGPLSTATNSATKENTVIKKSVTENKTTEVTQNFYTTPTELLTQSVSGTVLNLSSDEQARLLTLLRQSNRVSLLGQTVSNTEIETGAVKLGSQTTGAYVKKTVGGSGIDISGNQGEGSTAEVSLGDLSSDWVQGGGYDIILEDVSSSLKIKDASDTHYATLDIGTLSADTTFTLSGTSGTLVTSSNISGYLGGSGTGDLVSTNNLSDLTNAATARTNLALGTLAVQNAGSVAITGGSISGISALGVASGGTGVTSTPTNGQMLIGNGTGYALSVLSAGSGVGISNGSGTISITNSGVTALNGQTGSVTVAAGGINAVGASGGVVTVTGTEADTLSAVTGRGSSTATAVTLSNVTNAITAGTLTANGGTINGISIGGTTPAGSIFTSLSSSGATTLASGAGNALMLGNSTGALQIDSNGLDVSTGGALSGITGYTQGSGNVAISGSGTLSTATGALSLNGDTTIAANKDLTLASGDGVLGQTFSAITGTAHTLSITNSGSSGTNSVKGIVLDLTGTSGGTNTITGISFGTVTPVGSNTFNGLTFGTGMNNFLTSPTINLSAAGALTGVTGITLPSGSIDQSASSGTFSTGTGAVSLNGTTTVASGKTLAVTTADSLTVGGNKIPQTLFLPVPLTASVLTQAIFVADRDYQLTSAKCSYSIAASLLGTFQVSVDTGSDAPGSGTSQLSSAIDLSGTVNTAKTGTLIGTPTTIASGSRISTVLGGTLTGLLGTCTLGLKIL